MYFLYGTKPQSKPRLVATFDSEQQLLAYVRWATLSEKNGVCKFEQGSPLVGSQSWGYASEPAPEDDPTTVIHNPTPSML